MLKTTDDAFLDAILGQCMRAAIDNLCVPVQIIAMHQNADEDFDTEYLASWDIVFEQAKHTCKYCKHFNNFHVWCERDKNRVEKKNSYDSCGSWEDGRKEETNE